MSYFRYFPKDFYTFGNEERPDYVQNLSIYVDIVDQAKNTISFYRDYYIQDGERPDQISYKLYDTPNYHWTLFLMNDKLKQYGWPLKKEDVLLKVKNDFSGKIITTYSPLFVGGESLFRVGDIFENLDQTKFGVVTERDVNKGYIQFTETVGTFTAGDVIKTLDQDPTITINSVIEKYESIKHYTNPAGEILQLSVDEQTGGLQEPAANLTPLNYIDYYLQRNEDLKQIKVIRQEAINELAQLFREALQS